MLVNSHAHVTILLYNYNIIGFLRCSSMSLNIAHSSLSLCNGRDPSYVIYDYYNIRPSMLYLIELKYGGIIILLKYIQVHYVLHDGTIKPP